MALYRVTKDEYETLRQKREAVAAELTRLRGTKQEVAESSGDHWHDNPTFTETESRERVLMTKIAEWDSILAAVEIIEPPVSREVVDIGITALIRYENGEEAEMTIVGHLCGDPDANKVAYTAPLGAVLLGAKPGEKRTLKAPGRTIEVEVVRII